MDWHAFVHAVSDIFEFVQGGKAGGIDFVNFTFNRATVLRGRDHGRKITDRVELVAWFGAGDGYELLLSKQAVIAAAAFERSIDEN